MLHEFSRTELLIGKQALAKLKNSRVAVFGIGGVGTYVVEGLVRAGVGKLVLVDDDCICLTNINRQLHATRKTVGRSKVEVMRERILEINPAVEVEIFQEFYLPDNPRELLRADYDYVVDAIDTMTGKIALVVNAQKLGVPVISSMGAGNKLEASGFKVADIYKTTSCPLARIMRKELRERGIKALKVVYSEEIPLEPQESDDTSCANHCVCPPGTTRKCTSRRKIPGSISFVPAVCGLIIAGEVVKDLIAQAG